MLPIYGIYAMDGHADIRADIHPDIHMEAFLVSELPEAWMGVSS